MNTVGMEWNNFWYIAEGWGCTWTMKQYILYIVVVVIWVLLELHLALQGETFGYCIEIYFLFSLWQLKRKKAKVRKWGNVWSVFSFASPMRTTVKQPWILTRKLLMGWLRCLYQAQNLLHLVSTESYDAIVAVFGSSVIVVRLLCIRHLLQSSPSTFYSSTCSSSATSSFATSAPRTPPRWIADQLKTSSLFVTILATVCTLVCRSVGGLVCHDW